jgi:serine/threonine-protein kinase HipA
MTSETARECFVYITLPGETEPVTAGRFRLETRGQSTVGSFVYGRSYLANPRCVPIDPVELKLAPRTYETAFMGACSGLCGTRARTTGAVVSSSGTFVR